MEDFYTRVLGMVVSDRGYVPLPADLRIDCMTLDPAEHHRMILASGRTEGEIVKGPFGGGGRGSAINQISFHYATLTDMTSRAIRWSCTSTARGTRRSRGANRSISANPSKRSIGKPRRCAAPDPTSKWLTPGERG
jgi:hypothetical protein